MLDTQRGRQCYRLCLYLWTFKVNPPLKTTVNNFDFVCVNFR